MNRESIAYINRESIAHIPSLQNIPDQDLMQFAQIVARECVDICDRGNETQATSGGAAQMIRQTFRL